MNNIIRQLSVKKIHNLGYTGKDIGIAVLDTGCFSHNVLKNNIRYFVDFVNEKNTPYDDNSHGTHVCGIIAANGDSLRGMAPDAWLIPIKILSHDGTTPTHTFIQGINWILKNHKFYNIKIVNISIGMPSTRCEDESSLLVKAVNSLWDEGITVVASAGNNGPESYTITTPGISRKIITVGTNDIMLNRNANGTITRKYSSKGPTHCNIPKPDILAPGNNIMSCTNRYGAFSKKSGTSMSTPIVSGAAALLLSYDNALSNQDIKDLLCKNADYSSNKNFGVLNISGLFI